MKVGILTLSASDNCGSLLQAYALREVLIQEFDCDAEIINYVTKESQELYAVISRNFLKYRRKTLNNILHLPTVLQQRKDYANFREKYLKMNGRSFHTVKELINFATCYDVFIVGSDQVWNVNMFDYSDAYLLPWKTAAKKVSYAASLGGTLNLTLEQQEKIKRWLSTFYMISVREASGKKTLESLLNRDVPVLADPTLLLPKECWDILADKRVIKEDYIFFYSWAYADESMNELVRNFSQKRNLKVYVINAFKWLRFKPSQFNFVLFERSGPIAFLNLMKYAKFVFVQSFHGAVFANVFQKQFFFLNEQSNGKIDNRAGGLLKLMNEESRAVHDLEETEEAAYKNIDYATSNSGFDDLVQKSKEYLTNALN